MRRVRMGLCCRRRLIGPPLLCRASPTPTAPCGSPTAQHHKFRCSFACTFQCIDTYPPPPPPHTHTHTTPHPPPTHTHLPLLPLDSLPARALRVPLLRRLPDLLPPGLLAQGDRRAAAVLVAEAQHVARARRVSSCTGTTACACLPQQRALCSGLIDVSRKRHSSCKPVVEPAAFLPPASPAQCGWSTPRARSSWWWARITSGPSGWVASLTGHPTSAGGTHDSKWQTSILHFYC